MQLIIENVSFTYPSLDSTGPTIENLSFSVEKGDFIGITGKTGSGKTTLVKILAGLLKPSLGKVENNIGKVGLVFQYPENQLFEETVLKDIMFGPLNLGFTEEEARSKAKKAMLQTGLEISFEERNPFELSGGEKRRVAIAGILSMEPEILILDEPAAGLDSKMHNSIFSLLKELNQSGKTIVMVSHDMTDIAEYCNKVAFLENGKLVEFCPVTKAHNLKSEAFCLARELASFGLDLEKNIILEEQLIQSLK